MFPCQHITEFTWYREVQSSSILYLILTNEKGMVNYTQYVPYQGKNGHVCLAFNINMYASTFEKIKPKYAYHRGNYKKLLKISNILSGIKDLKI